MAAKQRSFWSSIPGLLTGLAGVLTGVVGLLGLALSQGWIGNGTPEEAGSGNGEDVVRISVEPQALEFSELPVQASKTVTVTNDGTGPIALTSEIDGEDMGEFSVDDGDCGGELPPGRSCSVTVTFDAGTGRYGATLVVSAEDGAQSEEVSLTGTAAL
jgi:hypothetical protein